MYANEKLIIIIHGHIIVELKWFPSQGNGKTNRGGKNEQEKKTFENESEENCEIEL